MKGIMINLRDWRSSARIPTKLGRIASTTHHGHRVVELLLVLGLRQSFLSHEQAGGREE